VVFHTVPRNAIIDALVHIRDLHRRVKPSNEREIRAYERREAATRDLLSNLPRTNEHPTLKTKEKAPSRGVLVLIGSQVR